MWFLTECGYKYTHRLWAESIDEAKELIERRGIGEEIIEVDADPPDHIRTDGLSDEEFLKALPEIIHQVTYLSHLAYRTGVRSPGRLLNEDGVIHQLVHYLNFPGMAKEPESDFEEIRNRVERLGRDVPGFKP